MNQEQFIERIKRVVEDPTVPACIKSYQHPAGRKPAKERLELSRWYNSLSDENQQMVERVMRDAVQGAIFGLLCVLDGVSAFNEAGEDESLELYYVKGSSRALLNDPDKEELHEIYNYEV